MEETKHCPRCDEDKDTTEFYKSNQAKDGLRGWCIECGKIDNKLREPEYRETRRRYRKEHKDEYREAKRKYYAENKEKILSDNAKWRQTKNGRFASYKRGAESRNIEFNLTFTQFIKYWKISCSYCGCEVDTIGIDRIDPALHYDTDNVAPCCSVCNIMKTNMQLDVFINKIRQIAKHTEEI